MSPADPLAPEIPADTDGRRERGRRTRASILEVAANIASVDGLEGLTIGHLATELGMSKSGLFAHFGSKEELQLATIDAAREIFTREVVAPALGAPSGLPRLEALVTSWLGYLRQQTFAGGCFFAAVRAEFDSRPDSPVREIIEEDQRVWQKLLAREARAAKKAGELAADTDVDQLLFEIDALGSTAGLRYQLQRDPRMFDRAAAAIAARLRAARAA